MASRSYGMCPASMPMASADSSSVHLSGDVPMMGTILPLQHGLRTRSPKRSSRSNRARMPRQDRRLSASPPSASQGHLPISSPPPASNNRGRSVLSPKSCPTSLVASGISREAPPTFSMMKGSPSSRRRSRVAEMSRGAREPTPPKVAVELASQGGEAHTAMGLCFLTRRRTSPLSRASPLRKFSSPKRCIQHGCSSLSTPTEDAPARLKPSDTPPAQQKRSSTTGVAPELKRFKRVMQRASHTCARSARRRCAANSSSVARSRPYLHAVTGTGLHTAGAGRGIPRPVCHLRLKRLKTCTKNLAEPHCHRSHCGGSLPRPGHSSSGKLLLLDPFSSPPRSSSPASPFPDAAGPTPSYPCLLLMASCSCTLVSPSSLPFSQSVAPCTSVRSDSTTLPVPSSPRGLPRLPRGVMLPLPSLTGLLERGERLFLVGNASRVVVQSSRRSSLGRVARPAASLQPGRSSSTRRAPRPEQPLS